MLDKEFQYFIDHQSELVAKFNGRFLVIVGESVVGDYAAESEAYASAVKNYKEGTFLIQRCISGTDAYRQTFHSRVAFQ